MMDRVASGGYKMDGYTLFPGEGLSSITTFAPQTDPNLQYLAHRFELADHNFQPAIAPTLPNVLYALAATAHGALTNNVSATGPTWSTIFDELNAARRSWRIYAGVPRSVFTGTVWERLLPTGTAANLTSTTRFFVDLKQGSLPDFSFIRPGVGYSEEPPEDLEEGDAWLGQIVSALSHSRYWDSTALFVTYDEGGGFFDHVAPPVVPTSHGYGTRTPMIIVSPWVRRGVYSSQTTNISILAFVQHLWSLPPLNGLDAEQNNLINAFDFHRRPLAPPSPPVVPPETIGFYGSSSLHDVEPAVPGQAVTINLEQNGPGLSIDPKATGHLSFAVTPPAGSRVPKNLGSGAELVGGRARLTITFPDAGYYRIEASGPGASRGWLTVGVGVNADTP